MFYALLILISLPAMATVYESDDRQLVTDASPAIIQELGASTAAMIDKSLLYALPDGRVRLGSKPLGVSDNLCEGERFYDEPQVSHCTGFLVAPNKLFTAGHCLKGPNDCAQRVWAFDYRGEASLAAEDLYECDVVEEQQITDHSDYALVRLKRAVVGRTPLRFARRSKARPRAEIFALGHPLGLPLTYSPGLVLSHGPDYFLAAIDTFHKSSGSPVLSVDSREVEGMLIFGGVDYKFNMGGPFSPKCNRFFVCMAGEDGCKGEGVMSSSVLQRVLERH